MSSFTEVARRRPRGSMDRVVRNESMRGERDAVGYGSSMVSLGESAVASRLMWSGY